jgi:phenylacetate-CoA ligase
MTATTMSQADRLRMLAGEMLQRERWSRERLVTHQQERLRELLAHAVSASPYYREALGEDPAATPFERLPTLSKPLLMEQWDRIACDPRVRRAGVDAHAASLHAGEPHLGEYQVFSTSGASGLRGLFVYNPRDWAVALAHNMRALARTGVRPGERTVGIGAPPGVHMSPRIFAALQSGGAVPPLSALTPLDEIVAALNAFRPDALVGYPTVATLLAAEQLAGRLNIGPRVLALGSEPLTAEMRGRLHDAWGIEPCEHYSTTEAPALASSTPEHPRALEIFEDLYVIEVVDDRNRPVAPGTAGAKVLVTNLENRTLPLIRYELADRVIESPEPNPAGRPFRHLAGIDGRTADTLTFAAVGGGTVAVLPLRMGAPFARLPAVRQFQIVHEPGRLEVRLVLDPQAPAGTPDQVRTAVAGVLEAAGAVPPRIDVTPVAELEREAGPAAKLKLIVSRAAG